MQAEKLSTTDDVILVNSPGWTELDNLLESEKNEVGVLSLSDNGAIQNGSEKRLGSETVYMGEIEAIKGDHILLDNSLVEPVKYSGAVDQPPIIKSSEDKNSADFYFGNLMGSPTEIKMTHDLPETEKWHTHTGYEVYKPINGKIELGLGGKYFEENISHVESLNREYAESSNIYSVEPVEGDEIFAVPPHVPHKVIDKEGDPSLAVIRYSEEEMIGKHWIDGTPAYPWIDEKDFRIESY